MRYMPSRRRAGFTLVEVLASLVAASEAYVVGGQGQMGL